MPPPAVPARDDVGPLLMHLDISVPLRNEVVDRLPLSLWRAQGDHGILASTRTATTAARTTAVASNAPQTPLRKTPSPKPPSPTPKPPSPVPSHRKTPSPAPPPELIKGRASPARAISISSSQRPSLGGGNSERTSPTQSSKGSGGASPCVEVQQKQQQPGTQARQAARSMSATPTPAPPTTGHASSPGPSRTFVAAPRSKSVASDMSQQNRVGAEARRPEVRRAMPCETLDAATQTDDADDVSWESGPLDHSYADVANEEAMLAEGKQPSDAPMSSSSSRSFLNRPVQLMAEMEMAMRGALEVFAEHETRRAVTFPEPRAPPERDTNRPSHASRASRFRDGFLGLGRQLSAPAATAARPSLAEEGSDGEDGHGEDAEVRLPTLQPCAPGDRRNTPSERAPRAGPPRRTSRRPTSRRPTSRRPTSAHSPLPSPLASALQVKSLSLSEDGPVIRRSVSEPYYNFFPRSSDGRGAALHPDPLAMLSDGERTIGERAIGGRGEPVLAFRGELPSLGDDRGDDRAGDELLSDKERCLGEFGADIDGEPLGSDRSAPGSAPYESDHSADHSAAPTHVADAQKFGGRGLHAKAGAPADEQALLNNVFADSALLPILEKAVAAGGGAGGIGAPVAAHPARPPHRRERPHDAYKRVPAKRSEKGDLSRVADLSQISRLPIPPGGLAASALADSIYAPGGAAGSGRPHSSRSDNASQLSFGSANSAFSPPSSLLSPSSSSSQLASPRPSGLKASQSTPALSVAHKGTR